MSRSESGSKVVATYEMARHAGQEGTEDRLREADWNEPSYSEHQEQGEEAQEEAQEWRTAIGKD